MKWKWLTDDRPPPLTPEQVKALQREIEGRADIRRQANEEDAEATLEAWDMLDQDQGEQDGPDDE